jgi:hypothetical protein
MGGVPAIGLVAISDTSLKKLNKFKQVKAFNKRKKFRCAIS